MMKKIAIKIFMGFGFLYFGALGHAQTLAVKAQVKFGRPITSLPKGVILYETVGFENSTNALGASPRNIIDTTNIILSLSTTHSEYYLSVGNKSQFVNVTPEVHAKLIADLESSSMTCPSRFFIDVVKNKIIDSSKCQPLPSGYRAIETKVTMYRRVMHAEDSRGRTIISMDLLTKQMHRDDNKLELSEQETEQLYELLSFGQRPVFIFDQNNSLVRAYDGRKLSRRIP